MADCPYCGTPLPGNERICKKCFDQHYSQVETPRTPILQQIATYIKAPLPIADVTDRPSLFANLLYVIGGFFFCWFGGVTRTDYKLPLLSAGVFQAAIRCSWIPIVFSLFFGRRGLRVYWTVVPIIFCLLACGVAGWYFIGSDAPMKLANALLGVGAVVYLVSKLWRRYIAVS